MQKKPRIENAPYAVFGNMLLNLRRKAGIALQSELATMVKSRQQTVSRWEAGLSRPRDTQMPIIAKALNAKVEDLLRSAGYTTERLAVAFDQPFPVDALSPESFERFCFHFLSLIYPAGRVHRAGSSGHAQQGLDIEVTLEKNRRHTFQCKRVDEFGPSKVHKAVADHTRKATKKFILLSRIASPQAREAIQQHAGWDIWDKEDISLRVRNLTKHEQLKLVDTFFRGQRLALLGEIEPGPWQTLEEFYAPFLTGHGVFSHAWQLVGKDGEVETLRQALSDEFVRAVFLTGAGGSGKSRVVKEAIASLALQNTLVTFLSPSEEVTSKSLEDLGDRAKILVIDDAHDRADLQLLFQFAAASESKTTLLLAFRPYGLDYIKVQASGFSLSGDLVREVKLGPLTLGEATKLAQQVLVQHGGPAADAEDIARLTRDCPLATVVGAIVVSKDKRPISLVANEDEFRATLLGRFQDVIAGEIGGKTDAEPIRRLLRVLALLQPFHPEERAVAAVAEQIEQLPAHEFHRLTRLLTDAGVLFRRGGKYRLSPDLLGDQIVENACIAQGDGSTGYAERVFDAASDAYLEHVLVNLGKLDWRRANGDPSNSRLLDGVWAKLRPRSDYVDPHINAVSAVAYYQPGRALDFAEKLIRQGKFLRDIPTIIRHAAYNYSHLRRACECLWQMGKDDPRQLNREPSHAIRILAELCEVEPNKPFEYNAVVVDFGISLLTTEGAMAGAYTPFDFLEGILAPEGHTTTSNGKSISWNRFSVSPTFVGPLREKVIDAAVGLLAHPATRLGVLAARFLGKAIQYGMNCTPEARRLWTDEFIGTLSKVESAVRTGNLNALVLVEIVQSVSWHAHRLKRETSAAARRVLDAIPDTFAFRTAVALLNAYGAVLGTDDFELLRKEIGARIDALVAEWLTAYPNVEELRNALATAIEQVDHARPKSISSSDFFWRLIRASPELAPAIVTNALVDTTSRTRSCIGMALGKMMLDDRAAGSQAVSRVLKDGAPDLVSLVGRAYQIAGIKEAHVDDLANVAKLLDATDERIVLDAIGILQSLAQSDPRLTAELMLHVNLGLSYHVADEALMVFYQKESGIFEQLTASNVEQMLRRLEKLPELEGHWIDSFLSRVSGAFPLLAADFFKRRVERAADTSDWQLRPCNFGPYGQVPLRFRETPESANLLREISAWMNTRSSKDDLLFRERAKQLFGAMFSPFDDVLVGFLRDWVRVATDADMRTIYLILDEVPNDFVFKYRPFVDELLQKAKQLSEKSYERATTALYGSATSGMRSGTVGEPFPQDVQMKADAENALKEIPRFSPSYEVYEEIRKSAVERIARSLREAERYEE